MDGVRTTYSWVSTTFDQVLSNSSCYIGCVMITSDGGGVADITLYDGESTSGKEITSLKGTDGVTSVFRFQPPLETQRGLYVDVGSNVDNILVQLAWEKE